MVARMDCKPSDKPKQKPKHRKGLWSPEEDQRLRNYILRHGHGCWSSVPVNAGLQRNGKSCRLRWINYLRPGLKRGMFSAPEEETIMNLHRSLGNKWSQIAQHLPGRTDNEIKNYWHSYLKKRIIKTQEFETQIKTDQSLSSNSDNNTEHPCYESSENMEKSCADNTDHSVHHISIDSLKEVNKPSSSSLPKLMFAEWLSLDSFANVNDQSVVYRSNNIFDRDSTFHENNLMHEYLLNGTMFFSDMFGPFKFEEHSSGSEDQFVNFSSGEDLCIDFDINNDTMYL